ncbi:helix-turn-helix domain-containing protein [Aurantimonas sp. A2-1-M11]|uniref:helix-turn-helix domain-containing protein n=1 Tax=Aurantimonas sp. A2-1-M11 TaxID=3113712 RepID=UPI002F941E0B
MTTSLATVCAPAFPAHEAGLRSSPRTVESTPGRGDGTGVALTGTVRNYAHDSEIYADGDDVRFFYKVVSGVVRTCKFLSDGRRQIDGFHAAGEIFGLEMSAEHTLSAEAVTDCAVIAYRWRGLQGPGSHGEPMAPQVFSYAMRCLERAQHHSLLLGRRGAAQRLAAFLLEMARTEVDNTIVDLAMTRQDIADYLGLTIETVSRTLSQFERDRLIALPSARHVVLRNRTALASLND